MPPQIEMQCATFHPLFHVDLGEPERRSIDCTKNWPVHLVRPGTYTGGQESAQIPVLLTDRTKQMRDTPINTEVLTADASLDDRFEGGEGASWNVSVEVA